MLYKIIIRIKRIKILKRKGWKKNKFNDWISPKEGNKIINDNSLSVLSNNEFNNIIKGDDQKI